ncbi:cell wall anchor protein [Nonlabens sp. YIK11]|uniref:hypothetical protein n=1 Tax=Nonlabens sp. YIK11 TaxID=1453349 RepID=UPI0006DC032A|nr:hypothetical protein [Nonlabens sp. YIK11]KQC32654.1 cell wall anchor protein [Nonlabens sp. YIK11]
MKKSLFIFCFLCFVISFAQVGIGTAMPDPSALLDISSSTQGMLAPRMTTTQRQAIVSPANGLLVYDTNDNSFFFYEGDSWSSLDPIKKRTNYKLVQSIADLSEELTAGSGSKYVLNTDFLYEINGTIIFDFPIDLNGAYIEGVDSSEDILVNNSSVSLFEGTSGGGLRNLTLSGNGKQLFDITGTATDLLLINNTVIAGASTVGTLSGLGTVFLSVTQYVSNADGLTIDNIDNFFVSNIFWSASNAGTFMRFTGTFENLQMNGGRIEAGTGETGIDVSSNPTIVNDATLAQLSFVGDGTLVNRYTTGSYTGYNFTKDWNVNCSGIPLEVDQNATANFYYNGTLTTGYTQPISNNTPVQLKSSSNFVASDLFRFAAQDNNNDLIYEGKKRRTVKVNVSLSVRVVNAAGDFYAFAIAKNGVIATETNSTVIINNDTQIQNVALTGVLTMQPGDRIEVFTNRLTGTGTDSVVIFSENLSVQ